MQNSSGKTRYVVLTGDIVNSSKLKAADRRILMESLSDFFSRYAVKSRNNLKLKVDFEIYRGDSFQSSLDVPAQSLRMALLIRTYLRSQVAVGKTRLIASDARIAIGIGSVNVVATTLG